MNADTLVKFRRLEEELWKLRNEINVGNLQASANRTEVIISALVALVQTIAWDDHKKAD